MKRYLRRWGTLLAALLLLSACATNGSSDSYTIQAGFFSDYDQAQARAAQVKQILGKARVDGDIIHYSAVYYVYSGVYGTPQAAGDDIAKLKKAGITARAVPNL